MKKSVWDHIREAAKAPGAFGDGLKRYGFWFFTVVYLEVLLHAVVYGGFGWNNLYAVGFSAAVAGILAVLLSFLPRKAENWVSIGLLLVLAVLYGSQMVYKFIFGTLYSVALMQQGGAAITSFWKETITVIFEKLLWLLALLIPLVIQWLRYKKEKEHSRTNWFIRVVTVTVAAAAYGITMLCLPLGGTGYFSDHYFYHSADTTTTQAAERFGLLTAFRLELTDTGAEEVQEEEPYYFIEETKPSVTEPTEESIPSGEDAAVETEPEETRPTGPNVIEIDFDTLNTMTENETILAINEYCASVAGTSRNEYTGMLHDYNLIVLCAESFATGAIDEELTPTLYKLANEGIIFNNFYNTYPNNTTDGEYTLCMGLYPDASRNKLAPSFYASKDSYLPFTLGNAFAEQAGVQSYGYHNYEGQFYGRDETHPNMGYIMKFAGDGMTFTTDWPASDLEMMEQSVDDYIGQEQFHAYYMTFSGHFKYDVRINPMVQRNWDAVKHRTELGEAARSYLACNVELDKALAYLLERLEAEGVADKTAIVIVGDHYPYGLQDHQYSQLVGYDIDAFTKYKSSLIFWVGGLEENIVVDAYCCNADILPTILNLWGFSYDSRMLAGTDVFSDGTHIAILSDQSFFTDKVWFNASTGKIQYLVDESELPENYVENMIRLVKTKFSISVDILDTAYYNFVFEKGEIAVSDEAWTSWYEWAKMTGAQ